MESTIIDTAVNGQYNNKNLSNFQRKSLAVNAPKYLCDLHVHTTASDGGYTPEEIVRLAVSLGLEAIAITDHDSAASNIAGVKAGEKFGLRVIPGVELTTVEGCHILGYFIQPVESGLYEYLSSLKRQSWTFMCKILERLRSRGLRVTEQELARRTGEGIPNMSHILDVMYARGDLAEPDFDSPAAVSFFGDPDYIVNFFIEFARTRPFIDAAGAIRLILSAGGVPVWAHPLQWCSDIDREELEKLNEEGLVGLEVITPKHGSRARRLLHETCLEFDLIPTGGTDYHGRFFESIEKSRKPGSCGIEPQLLERLEGRALKLQAG